MLTPELKLQMLRFVRCFEVVKERQIKKFFSDWGEGSVSHVLSELLYKGHIVRLDGEHLSYVRHLPHPLRDYEDCMTALDVMITIRSKKMLWFNREEYPLELTFLTTDNVIYDVAVFDSFWTAKAAQIRRKRKEYLPENQPESEDDPIQHIAVVESEEQALKLSPDLGFHLYAQANYDGHVEFFELD